MIDSIQMPAMSPEVHALRQAFQDAGFDIRIVGGPVRDLLIGETPKDIDLCTDASPEEQMEVFRSAGVRFVETGLKHGTLTAILEGEGYEITSLRTETGHTGRHAEVTFIRDWELDLARRDLTINAMSLGFGGDLMDPFGGRRDLATRTIRFVGDARERMREDFLRILRWLRFEGRFNPTGQPLDEACAAAQDCAAGLQGISRERVWAEFKRIVAGGKAEALIALSAELGIVPAIGLPAELDLPAFAQARQTCKDPAALMAMLVADPVALGRAWRWSTEELQKAALVQAYKDGRAIDCRRLVALDGVPVERASALALAFGRLDQVEALQGWSKPDFPVSGHLLAQAGIPKGPQMGLAMNYLKEVWAENCYQLSCEALMEALERWQAEGSAPSLRL